ncbi:hypothetical protein [Thalassotalea piscium]
MFYHLGHCGSICIQNSYTSYKNRIVNRKPEKHEIKHGIHLKRAAALHIFGQKVSHDPTDIKSMCDVIHRAWVTKTIGTAFTLRCLKWVAHTTKGGGQNPRYCDALISSIRKSKGMSLT